MQVDVHVCVQEWRKQRRNILSAIVKQQNDEDKDDVDKMYCFIFNTFFRKWEEKQKNVHVN